MEARAIVRRSLPAALLTMVLTACAGGEGARPEEPPAGAQPETHDLAVSFVHNAAPFDGSGISRQNDTEGNPCGVTGITRPTDALMHMRPGATVIATDAAGTVVGKSQLGNGSATGISPAPKNTYTCTWRAGINAVPESPFYTLSVGGQDVATVSLDELERAGWRVTVPARG